MRFTMHKDPVVEEMRQNSARLAEECGYDVARFAEGARRRETASGRRIVTEPVGEPALTVARLFEGLSAASPASDSDITSQSAFFMPILEALAFVGGRADRTSVIEGVGRRVGPRLTLRDRESQSDGGIRWEQNVEFAKRQLVILGLLLQNASREPWELTDAGWRVVREIAGGRVA
jgi:hypothetical protein